MTMITRLWIEVGCISCEVCQDAAPEVFHVRDGEDCSVLPGATAHFSAMAEQICAAALDCPVEVIQYEAD